MARLFMMRHGQTDWNAQLKLQGSSDVPLNDTGRAQIAAGARALARELRPGVRILSSPLSRARDTAEALGQAAGAAVEIEPLLVERSYGIWEGMTRAEREADFPVESERWSRGQEPNVDGYEGHRAVTDRVRQLLGPASEAGDVDIVWVSHGSTLRMALDLALGLPTDAHRIRNLDNAHWAQVECRTPGPWELVAHNVGAAV